MFSKAAIVVSTVFAIGVMADLNQCNTGPVQCCNSLKSSKDEGMSKLLSIIGVAVSDVTAQVGLDCSPIGAVGINGNSCSTQPVCCEHNNFNGAVVVGCSPINANL